MSIRNSESLLTAVRTLYSAIEHFDTSTSHHLNVDRSALRAINAMEKGPLSPGQLSIALGLTSGSITALLDRLEAAGHIERNFSNEDRRRRDADLSKSTRKKADAQYGLLAARIEEAFENYSEKEKAHIADVLLSLAATFKPRNGHS